MSADYLNIEQLINKLNELKDLAISDDVPVCFSDSSGYDYYVRDVIIKNGEVVIV